MRYKDKVISSRWAYFERLAFIYRYRYDPVPGIHKLHNTHRKYFRNPRTTQEIRFSYSHKQFVKIRGKRSKNSLPKAYSDLTISDNRIKSWKRTKKRKQWMRFFAGGKKFKQKGN